MKQKLLLLSLAAAAVTSAHAQLSPYPAALPPTAGVYTPANGFSSFLTSVGLNSLNPVDVSSWVPANAHEIRVAPGASFNVFFVSETAGYLNDLGFNVGGFGATGAGARTLQGWKEIDQTAVTSGSLAGDPRPGLRNGYFTTVSSADLTSAGLLSANTLIDFWLNGSGRPAFSGSQGGVWSLFNTAANADNAVHGRTAVSTYTNPANGRTIYLYAYEDLFNLGDSDKNDLVFGVEIISGGGNPTGNGVPEPSTYGLLGAGALGLLVMRRWMARRKA